MKKHIAIICIGILVLSLALCGCGDIAGEVETTAEAIEEILTHDVEDEETEITEEPATEQGYPLDIKAIEEVESRDDFSVKIADKSVIEKYSVTVSLAGSDALVFAVENNTGKTVTDFEIYFIGYDENENKVQVGIGAGSVSLGGQSKFVTTLNPAEDSEIKDGETINIMTYCKAETFKGVKAIVASYTDSEGNIYENPIADEWYLIANDAVSID